MTRISFSAPLLALLLVTLAACGHDGSDCAQPYPSKEVADACRERETLPEVTGPDAWGK